MEGRSPDYSNKTTLGCGMKNGVDGEKECVYNKYDLEDETQRLLKEVKIEEKECGYKYDWEDKKEVKTEAVEYVYKYDLEDEVQRLLKEVNVTIEIVKESNFYPKLKEQITGDEFQEQLKSVLEPNSKLKMVIYGLGSLEYGFNPHYQLAIALLLERNCSWIEGVEVYDPLFTSADIMVLKELGCEVLEVNDRGRRKVEEPTLFYMPYSSLLENILEANWCPSQINRLIVLTNKNEIEECNNKPEEDIHMKAIYKYIKEISVEDYGGIYDNIFYDFAWHFFHVDPQLDLENLIADQLSKTAKTEDQFCGVSSPSQHERKVERTFKIPLSGDERYKTTDWARLNKTYRGPRRYRCHSDPPPEGWIKLYISGIGAEGETNLAGFGGICYNEFKEAIRVYNGSLGGNVDGSAACLEALKQGLSSLVSEDEQKKLIVEGDDLKVIQWANTLIDEGDELNYIQWNRQVIHWANAHNHGELHKEGCRFWCEMFDRELPKEVCRCLSEIFELVTKFKCVIYHIYGEANSEAISLAKKGAMSRSSG